MFDHEGHLRLTHAVLRQLPLPETMIVLREFFSGIGGPKYHETITFFMATLIASRMNDEPTFEHFIANNPDLLEWPGLFERFYPPTTLTDARARQRFLLPQTTGRGISKTDAVSQ